MSSSKNSSLPSALLESLRSIGYTLETALADIIDNSVTAQASSISIRFLWNNGKPWIAVCDDGVGMSDKQLIEAMRFGFRSPSSKRDSNDLGRFGLGMKTASISQCRHLTVVSRKGRITSASEWNLDAMASKGASDWNATKLDPNALPKHCVLTNLITKYIADVKSGTIVLWENLDVALGDPAQATGEKRFSANMDSARRHLELVFHRFLAPNARRQKVAIDFNDSPLKAYYPFGSSTPARQELPAEKIRMQGQTVTIQPYVLPHRMKARSLAEYERDAGEEGYLHNQGFYIYRSRRLIIKATWFRLIPKDELNKLIRIRVDIPNSLDDLWRLDIKKSQAHPPETVLRELKRIIKKISGAGRIVFTNRATKLRDRTVVPVWKREVVEGKIHYGVNEDHPLVKALVKDLPKEHLESLRACFELLNSAFPYDMYYADAADDKSQFATAIADEETIRKVGIQLVRALRSCGFEGAELRRQLENTEFFKCSKEMTEEILVRKQTRMVHLDKLIDSVAVILEERQPPTEEALRDIVKAQAAVLTLMSGQIGATFSDEDVAAAVRTLEARFSIRMSLGSLFEAEDYQPWLTTRQGEIDWFYWRRYRKHLLKKGFPPHVVTTLDRLTDKILDHLEDPQKPGNWARKGLVVGHVQSGKTANYTGVICKAADAGYRVIIVLAGTLNSLRNQTQERIDRDFIGWCTREKKHIGASTFGAERRPVCFTTSVEDFKKQTANSIAMGLAALNEPIVLVIKKNKSTLDNLYSWLSDNNQRNLQNFPMLLIDDEADQASINTNKADKDPTAINSAIRNLLSLFTRSSFVGYTATPFANIFVDPETEDEMENGALYRDLFPRDFILSLDPPDNYVGPHRLFMDDADLDCIRDIVDNEDFLPIKHPIHFTPEYLPESLREAVCCFLLAIAIRLLRGQAGNNHSMMVNASRFTKVQNILGGLVLDYLKQLKQSIANYAALSPEKAAENKDILFLNTVFNKEFALAGFAWPVILKKLKDATDPVELLILNFGSQDTLDYNPRNYPNGRRAIAVGGLGLSRGLTLEGLVTSYFLRNSIMYDTLMQMGRWFGYRDSYADLCRIYMTPAADSWYSHIADATEELRRDFKAMERAKLTPKEFGLRVRSHPTSLIVTARNKMRSGRRVPMQIALEGRLVETSVLFGSEEILRHNKAVLETVCANSGKQVQARPEKGLGHVWKSVSPGIISSAIQAFENHPECLLTYAEPLIHYIEWLASQGVRFDVLLRSQSETTPSYTAAGIQIAPVERTVPFLDDHRIEFNKRRVASKGDERAGLKPEEIKEIKDAYNGKNLPDRLYRQVPGRNPLFMITFADVKRKGADNTTSKIVPAYGISFPGDSGSTQRPAKLVEYVVNTKWWEQNYDLPDDDPDDP